MDNIIPLIVILITIWSILSKLKAKQKKQPRAAPLIGGWATKLQAFLIDIRRQMEQPSTDHTTGPSGWDRLLDESGTFRSPSDAEEKDLNDQMFEEAETQPPLKKTPPAAPVSAHIAGSDRTQFVPEPPRRKALHAGKPSRSFMAASRADLRKAVIWSEIIGPPIALRDGHSGRR